MEKVIYNKFDKKGIATLPRAVFGGRIFVITTADEAEKAVRYLLSQKILGVDTETKPSFKMKSLCFKCQRMTLVFFSG